MVKPELIKTQRSLPYSQIYPSGRNMYTHIDCFIINVSLPLPCEILPGINQRLNGTPDAMPHFWLAASAANHYTTRWVRRPTIYTAIQSKAFGSGVAVGLIVRIETLLAIVCHRIFMIILVEYRLGLLGIQMYHGFKRLWNHTDISFAHL